MQYLQQSRDMMMAYMKERIPRIKLAEPEATYLMWLDCSGLTDSSEELADVIRESTGLYLSEGGQYGGDGTHFLRLNVACPRSVLEDGLNRLKKGVEAYCERQ